MLFSYFKRKLKLFLFCKGWVDFVCLEIRFKTKPQNLIKIIVICFKT